MEAELSITMTSTRRRSAASSSAPSRPTTGDEGRYSFPSMRPPAWGNTVNVGVCTAAAALFIALFFSYAETLSPPSQQDFCFGPRRIIFPPAVAAL